MDSFYSSLFLFLNRFKLPCLLKACQKAQSRLQQVLDSQADDETDDCIATDVEKLEENLWKSDDGNEDFQTAKDKEDELEDDLLNDDDIEEIMIFQTQSLQRKASENRENERKDFEELLSLDTAEEISEKDNRTEKFGDHLCYNKSRFSASEKTKQKLGERIDDDSLSRCLVEDSYMSRNSSEKSSVSRNPAEESHLSQSPDENDGNSAVEKDKVELVMSCVKENIVEEDVIIKKEQLPLGEESKRDDCEETRLLSRDAKVISRAYARDGEPIRDSHIEARYEDHVHEISGGRALGGELEQSCAVDENLKDVEEVDLEKDADCAHIFNVSADLLDDENEVGDGDVKEKDVSDEIQDNLSDFKPNESENLNDRAENNNEVADKTLRPLSAQGRWNDDEVFPGSPGEVAMPESVESDDEMEEMAPNQSITLISDNEEEVCLFVCLLNHN